MLTLWKGAGIASLGAGSGETDLFALRSVHVVLQDPPQLPTRVLLAVTCHAVNLFTPGTDVVWYELDTDPGPIVPPHPGPVVEEAAFGLGGVLTPNLWQQVLLPLDATPHTLHLVSAAPYVPVYVVMLVEPEIVVSYR